MKWPETIWTDGEWRIVDSFGNGRWKRYLVYRKGHAGHLDAFWHLRQARKAIEATKCFEEEKAKTETVEV